MSQVIEKFDEQNLAMVEMQEVRIMSQVISKFDEQKLAKL
jgi:hypothetical protein